MNNLKFHISTIVLFLVWNFTFSQGYANYTTKDGLPSNLVYRITQDHKGFIWLITDKGISKFDGYSFKNFTIKDGLPTNDIWNIRITPDHKVWFFSESDALGYIKNDSIYSFKTSKGKVIMPVRINQFKNSIWVNEAKYRHEFKEGVWQEVKMDIQNFKLQSKGLSMALNEDSKLFLENENKDILLTSKSNIKSQAINYQLNDSLYVIRNDDFFEIINLNAITSKYVNYKDHQNFGDRLVNARFHTVNNEIQLTGNNHLVILDDNLNAAVHYNIPESLNSHYSFKDKDGWVWVATFTDGIYKLPKNYDKINSYFPGKRISCINAIEGTIYTGVLGEGVYKIIDNRPELIIWYDKYIYETVKIDKHIVHVLEFDIYIEKDNELIHVPRGKEINLGKRFVDYKSKMFSEGYLSIYDYKMENPKESRVFDGRNYSGIFVQNDTLFSSDNKQLVYYNETSRQFTNYKDIVFRSRFLSSTTYKNKTFISLEGQGLYTFKNGKLQQMMANDHRSISKIWVQDETSIWCVSNNILENYKEQNNGQHQTQNYPELNGLRVANLKDITIRDNYMFLGTENGLISMSINDITNSSNYAAYIKSIAINGETKPIKPINLNYNKNKNINIDFSALNFANASQTKFEYLLQPIQKNWVTTTAGEINLNNLEPGKYDLKMKVFDDKNESISSLSIRINPLWWQTIWFKILFVLISVALVALVSRYISKRSEFKRNQRIFEDKRLSELQLKALRSQMNPHFVFNSLSAIQYFINSNDFESSERYLVKFSKLVRQFFELSKENDIAIKDEITLLQNYLDIEKLRFKEKLEFKFKIAKDLNLQSTRIPTMLLQPIVENAINHGIFNKEDSGALLLQFKKVKADVVIEIIDDGVGFAKTTSASKNKIKSSHVLKDRLYFLNQSGKWSITYSEEEAFSDRQDKGNKSTFIIKNLNE